MKKRKIIIISLILMFILLSCDKGDSGMFKMFGKFGKNNEIEDSIDNKDPFKRWNPDNKSEKDIEIYDSSMAEEIFDKTYAYKLYNQNNKDLKATRETLMNVTIGAYFTMYYDLALEFSDSRAKSKDLGAYLADYESENDDGDVKTDVVYRTQLVAYAQKASDIYYNIVDMKLISDLMGEGNDPYKNHEAYISFIYSYIDNNGRELFVNKTTNIFGRQIRYDEDIKNKLIELLIYMAEYTKNDMPYQQGDKEFIKKETVIKRCMENMDVLEYFDDLKYAIYEAEKEYFK